MGLLSKMSENFSSISPFDDSDVWTGEATTADEIREVMQRSAVAAKSWRRTEVTKRIEITRRFASFLGDHRGEIEALIRREVGKLRWDASAEVGASIAKVELSIQALQQRRREASEISDVATRTIRYQPLGVTLVLGPFNFPLHLPGGQIIPALLAGNSVVFKPSDQATAVGIWVANAWREVGLPKDVLQIIVGGVGTAVTAIDAPEVSGVFLTGSRSAGRAIHRQLAGRPEVLLALELGGNNPIVVGDGVDSDLAASIVSFSAFVSAGQRCTCARRAIYIRGEQCEQSIETLVRMTQQLRVGLDSDDHAPHVGPLISKSAADSLRRTYEDLIALGCKPLVPWRVDSRRANLVHPAILEADADDDNAFSEIGELEWFGPILVVRQAADLQSATRWAAKTPYGLAASLLGGHRGDFEKFVEEIHAGVVNWNRPTTGAAGTLPFGGLGHSGNHRPAGFFAIDFCNAPVASLEVDRPDSSNPWNITQ